MQKNERCTPCISHSSPPKTLQLRQSMSAFTNLKLYKYSYNFQQIKQIARKICIVTAPIAVATASQVSNFLHIRQSYSSFPMPAPTPTTHANKASGRITATTAVMPAPEMKCRSLSCGIVRNHASMCAIISFIFIFFYFFARFRLDFFAHKPPHPTKYRVFADFACIFEK